MHVFPPSLTFSLSLVRFPCQKLACGFVETSIYSNADIQQYGTIECLTVINVCFNVSINVNMLFCTVISHCPFQAKPKLCASDFGWPLNSSNPSSGISIRLSGNVNLLKYRHASRRHGKTFYFVVLPVIFFYKTKPNYVLGGPLIGVRAIENPHREDQNLASVAYRAGRLIRVLFTVFYL